MHQIGQLHIGDAAILLQLVEDLDIRPVEFHHRLAASPVLVQHKMLLDSRNNVSTD